MTLDDVFNSIDHYLNSEVHAPRLVDLPTRVDEMDFIGKYGVPGYKVMWAQDFCKDDMLPSYDKIMNEITRSEENIFLFGMSTFLKLEGEGKLVRLFKTMTELEPKGKLVIISLGCGAYFKRHFDRRLFDSSRVLIVDNEDPEPVVRFEFVERRLSADFSASIDGINKADKGTERSGDEQIIVRTSHTKKDFPKSLIDITECSSTYDLLIQQCSDLNNLPKETGTDEQWNYLYRKVYDYDSFSQYVIGTFGGSQNLVHSLLTFKDYEPNKKWGLFVAFKVFGAGNSEYLSEVINASKSLSEFCYNLYALILGKDRKRKDFEKLYKERKNLLKAVCGDMTIVSEFCKQVIGKEADAIYYLTNLSQLEEEQIISTISHYADQYDRGKLLNILELVYPQLAAYLRQYDYKDGLLNRYFNEYKYNKVTNKISDSFQNKVEEQAVKREYNKLQPRATFVDKLQIDEHCSAYFVDALGVEYLSYLQSLCHDNNLLMSVDIGRCNLPSVTEYNKDFVDTFSSQGINVISVKDIDDIMHEGRTKYNYEQTKEPIHISAQLQALDTLIYNVKENLYNGTVERVFLLSDHGASRMAVIEKEKETYEAENAGQHGGRCCRAADSSNKPGKATEENGYWCMANYDRFKGGNLSGVELHGGATLEEVCVPIITITKKEENINCYIVKDSQVISVSFKKKARITIYISKELNDVSIRVENGEAHEPDEIKNKFFYSFTISEIKRAKTYRLNVYSGDNLVAEGLTFEVKKEGANERKFF